MWTITQRRNVGRRRLANLLLLAAVAAATTAVGAGGADAETTGPCETGATAPAAGGWDHVALIVFENKALPQVMGNTADAPYLNSLAKACTSSSMMYSLSQTSLANYVALTSGFTGSPKEITSNLTPTTWPQDSDSLFKLMGSDAREWAESMPSNCYLKGSGNFTVSHTPYQYFTNARTLCLANALPLTASSNPLSAKFNLIIPNKIDDMHKTSTTTTLSQKIKAGDNWAKGFIPGLLASPVYQAGKTAIIITFDEGNAKELRVPFIVISPSTKGNQVSSVRYDHYSVLKGIEEMLGVTPLLGHANDSGTVSIRTDPKLGL